MALRWGICSAAKISHDFIVALKTLPESSHKIVAVAARSLESATKLANTHSIPKAYGSYDELATDPDIDVVYIGTIHPAHLSAASKMLEAGKPVLCEKPLTMNAAETKTLIELARSKNLFLMEGVWMRYFPVMVELRRLLAAKSIGDVQYVNVTFGFRLASDLQDHRLVRPDLGASAVLDIGVYVINFASMVFNGERPEKIHAEGILSPHGIDNLVAITFTYPGNHIAQLTCSVVSELPCEALVCGTKGEIKIPKRFWCPTKLETSEGTKEYPLPKPYMPTNFANSEGFCYEAEEVRKCLLEGMKESSVMPLDETQMIAEIMDEVLRQVGYSPKS